MSSAARSLNYLVSGLPPVAATVSVTDISTNSATVERGGLFLACAGVRQHGSVGAREAIARGARAILWESLLKVDETEIVAKKLQEATFGTSVFHAPVSNLSFRASHIADKFFASPSAALRIAGITGTNGKTTTAWLLAQALQMLGVRCAYSGTMGVGFIPNKVTPQNYTTADAVTVQRQLASVREAGASCVAMEVSSHALSQQRVAGVRFSVAAFSNLSREHLDYHGTLKAYGETKASLFSMPELQSRVINIDDAFGAQLALQYCSLGKLVIICRTDAGRAIAAQCIAQGSEVTVLEAYNICKSSVGLSFQLRSSWGNALLELPLIGEFNVDNALLALGVMHALGVPSVSAYHAISAAVAPPGRMEALRVPGRALTIIDYAHTPDALEKSLRAARTHCDGRLHVVFGCGGDRDQGKRSLMAQVAAQFADEIMITDDNPRTESPADIISQIIAGLPSGRSASIENDRASAIIQVLSTALPDDTVLIAGKGHERYQIIGTERIPYSDQDVVRKFFFGVH